jgi:transcriptional regulator with XRE-family HTH domain
VDRSYLSQLENDKKSPTVDLLFRICDALGVAPSDLLARVEKSRRPRRRAK